MTAFYKWRALELGWLLTPGILFFRLDGVSSRFQETSAEFEQARNKARKAKIEFETVKKNRLVTIHSLYQPFKGHNRL